MKFVKIFMYAVIGGVLGNAGVHATEHWQFWVVMVSIVAIDILSGLTQRVAHR